MLLKRIIKIPLFKRILPSLGIKFLKLVKKNRGYFKVEDTLMFLDFLDPIDREIILYQKYEDEEISDLIDLIKKNSVKNFFDVGANCGYYSLKLFNKIKDIKIVAFEPNKEAYLKFEKTIEVNKNFSKNVKLRNYGLSNKNSSLRMKFLKKHGYDQTGGSSVIEDINYNKENTFLGEFRIGDEALNFNDEKLCFKIDVERHELKVLEGLKKTFISNKIILLIEIYKKNFDQVNKLLNEMGLKLKKSIKDRSNYFYTNF